MLRHHEAGGAGIGRERGLRTPLRLRAERWHASGATDPTHVVVRRETRPDPFAGAGTTGIAALAEGRRFLGLSCTPVTRRLRGAGWPPRFGSASAAAPARHRARDRRGSDPLGTRGADLRGLPHSANSS
jgi:hypothetical protein